MSGWKRCPYGYTNAEGTAFLERGARMTNGGTAWLIWLAAVPGELEFDRYGAYSHMGGTPARTLVELQTTEWDTMDCGAAEMAARTDWMVHTNDAGSLTEAKLTAELVLAERGSKP